ncbi:MAG TPA: lytic transglycosylase domain-containing protein [Candidatus Sulfotelmatobacter sp.]|jgi:membrane-bound lytic murein transglycosylase D|nr:lytic transglycosylase domain-containing protein [Candidatus Sulfotelmatobacter sp.]
MNYLCRVKFAMVILFALLLVGNLRAQTNAAPLDADTLMNAAQQFAKDNLGDDAAAALQNVDRDQVRDFLQHYQDYLKGDYVLDLAQLKVAAITTLPLLEAREETQPLAAWLRARMDYFDVAENFETNLPPSQVTNGMASTNPPFTAEKEIWVKKVAPEPWPEDATNVVPKLKPIFASEGVPEPLVWIAEVESRFDAEAESPAGALGLFQLMPATAKEYGLSTWPFDERKEVEPSAHAAAKFLRNLHSEFGDWRLAVAAYNCGPGRVQRTLDRYHAKSYSAIATNLPAETQMYVPRVEATIHNREGLDLEKL